MLKKIIISEKQEKKLVSLLKENSYIEPTPQNPSMKKANKPYSINPDNVLLVKKFLDNGFTAHDWEKVGANGLPEKIKIFSMNASNGEPLKWLYQDQLQDLLIDHFQNMFSDHLERELFMKQVLNDWINGRIGTHGILSTNFLKENTIKEKLTAEREKVNINPTEKQCKAGNYKMGHVSINGFEITIENPKGSYRKGKDKNGKEWKTLMRNDYGYFTKTVGKDGDAIDVFLGPYLDDKIEDAKIYPIDQYIDGEFDETKVMMGFRDKDSAKSAYLSNYDKNWKGFKYITEVDIETFKKWLYDGYRQRKPFAKYVTLTESVKSMVKNGVEKKLRDTVKQMVKDGKLPLDHSLEMAEWYHNIIAKALSIKKDDVYSTIRDDDKYYHSIIDDEFTKCGGKYDLMDCENHKKSVEKDLKKLHSIKEDKLISNNINENKKNDEGNEVPEKCDKCGGKVELQIHGEPVYTCSKCGKYFGTMPFNNRVDEMAYPSSFDMGVFKKIKSFNKRIEYCQSRLSRISSGSARIVYRIDDEKVLKLAKNQKGIAQNEVEGQADYYRDQMGLFAKVYDVDENYLWIEMQLAKKAKPSDFKRLTGYDFNTVCCWIDYCKPDRYRRTNPLRVFFESPEFEENWNEYGLLSKLQEYIGNFDIPIGDLKRISSWGIVNGEDGEELVLIDYGLDYNVGKQFYNIHEAKNKLIKESSLSKIEKLETMPNEYQAKMLVDYINKKIGNFDIWAEISKINPSIVNICYEYDNSAELISDISEKLSMVKKIIDEFKKQILPNYSLRESLEDFDMADVYKNGIQNKPNYDIELNSEPSFDNWKRVRNKNTMLMNLRNTETGELLSNQWFDWIGYMVNGIAIISLNNKYNLINGDGEIILPEWHEDIWDQEDGTYEIKDGEKSKIITLN